MARQGISPRRQRAAEIIDRLTPGASMAEVGTYNGRLARLILERVPNVSILMVDNWKAAEDQPEAYKATGDHSALATPEMAATLEAEARSVEAKYERAKIAKGDSVNIAKKSGLLDLVFIDADHSEEGARSDVLAWIPNVKPGGWIGGHDYGHPQFPGVRRAVDSLITSVETGENYTWWHRVS